MVIPLFLSTSRATMRSFDAVLFSRSDRRRFIAATVGNWTWQAKSMLARLSPPPAPQRERSVSAVHRRLGGNAARVTRCAFFAEPEGAIRYAQPPAPRGPSQHERRERAGLHSAIRPDLANDASRLGICTGGSVDERTFEDFARCDRRLDVARSSRCKCAGHVLPGAERRHYRATRHLRSAADDAHRFWSCRRIGTGRRSRTARTISARTRTAQRPSGLSSGWANTSESRQAFAPRIRGPRRPNGAPSYRSR